VVHVLDASRAVPVVGSLLNSKLKKPFAEQNREEQERARARHAGSQAKLISIEEARRRAPQFDWTCVDLPQPEFIGVRVLSSDVADDARRRTEGASNESASSPRRLPISLADLVPFIDWSPFFHTWELRGRYPAIFKHEKYGEQARKLFEDAQRLLDTIVSQKLLAARGVYGLFPANSAGDNVELYADESRTSVLATFRFLRQQIEKPEGQPSFCLADFIAPRWSPSFSLPGQPKGWTPTDHLGAFAVTSGHGLKELVERFKKDHDDYNLIMAEALADRLAEAFAEYLHQRVREEWGYGRTENLTTEQMIEEQYRGIRPAAGYPACPDHTEKRILWRLLEVEKNAGIQLTESGAMWPGSSVSGLYFAHPESKYFAVGKLGRDQMLDYHWRKGMTLQEVERWLGPNLNYEPAKAAAADAELPAALCSCGVPHPKS